MNYGLIQSGVLTASDAGFGSNPRRGYVSLTFNGENPIVAWSSSDGVVLAARSQNGSSFTFFFYTENPATTFTYYVFDRPTAVSNWGFRIINPVDRKVVFDAQRKYMRVVDFWTVDTSSSGVISRSYSAGRNYAVAQCLPGLQWIAVTGPPQGGNIAVQSSVKKGVWGKAGNSGASAGSLIINSYTTTTTANAPSGDTGTRSGAIGAWLWKSCRPTTRNCTIRLRR
jgi:hypothetical protein